VIRLIAVALAVLLGASHAPGQTPAAVPRVGVVHHGREFRPWGEGLRRGLRELGLEEGKHLILDIRETNGDQRAVETSATDLERRSVALICTVSMSVTLAARRATTKTPLVFFVGSDPVAAGLVEGFARPGGRLTGVHNQLFDLTGKRLEILKETIPKLRRVVTFYDPSNPVTREGVERGRAAAQQLGVEILERRVSSAEELRRSLQELRPREVDAFIITPDAIVASQSQLIIDAAKAKRLPTMFHEVSRVANGALASYGYNYREAGRMAAKYVQRLLAGTQPGDLPVENYDRIELALNLRTARDIGVTIPPSVRARADVVIE